MLLFVRVSELDSNSTMQSDFRKLSVHKSTKPPSLTDCEKGVLKSSC